MNKSTAKYVRKIMQGEYSKSKTKPNYTTGYHIHTDIPKDTTTTIESHIHGKLSVKRNTKGKVESVSLISRGRD